MSKGQGRSRSLTVQLPAAVVPRRDSVVAQHALAPAGPGTVTLRLRSSREAMKWTLVPAYVSGICPSPEVPCSATMPGSPSDAPVRRWTPLRVQIAGRPNRLPTNCSPSSLSPCGLAGLSPSVGSQAKPPGVSARQT